MLDIIYIIQSVLIEGETAQTNGSKSHMSYLVNIAILMRTVYDTSGFNIYFVLNTKIGEDVYAVCCRCIMNDNAHVFCGPPVDVRTTFIS